ncbi:hypothetical protein N7523_001981 [Penicillium sp. IBT 18751x]|nr:hypothetical protein N7523_001981 [Penicillium sp. IBT 18751x]
MGAMDNHHKCVLSACPNDCSFLRPQQRQCTFRSPCRNLQLDPISRLLYTGPRICGIYIFEAIRALKSTIRIRGREGRKVIIHLLWVNVLVIVLNILLLLTEDKLHYIQVSFKTVVYSIKLKLEFSVLNRLRSLMLSHPLASPQNPMQQCRPSNDMNVFQTNFSRSIVALDVTIPSSTGPVGFIRCYSPSSSIIDYHETLREISYAVA